jgi:hypothetical protein
MPHYRTVRSALIAAALACALAAAPASADSGSGHFTAATGEYCHWNGVDSSVHLYCSGYSRGTYVNYSCDIQYVGHVSYYQCRDHHGSVWSGSR